RAGIAVPGITCRGRAPRWRWAPALTAAAVVALVAVMIGSVPIVRVPEAQAARALARIASLFIEREIVTFDENGAPEQITREKIWFKAPGSVRIESVTDGITSLTIERPGVRYNEEGTDRVLETGLLPSTTPLPEPLTPTIALLGEDAGPGPDVLGRPTRRIVLAIENQRRVALVDVREFSVVGVGESVVVGKEVFDQQRILESKRVLALEYNPVLPDALFAIPPGARVVDLGAQPRPLGALTAPPAGRLEGLSLIAAAARPPGQEAILYAKGAFQVLVEIDGAETVPFPSRRELTRVGSADATLVLPLYGLPQVRFTAGGHRISVSAPLPRSELIELAANMYPNAGE
ncbi:MAG: hypothetical protein ACRDKS_13955, partial [Actinomycetota bacterium]